MTEREALCWLQERECTDCRKDTCEDCKTSEALWIAEKALGKQVPKKIILFHHCPNCGWGLPNKDVLPKFCEACFMPKFCSNCGQHLDWSEVE